MAITPAFQVGDAGSIPATRSKSKTPLNGCFTFENKKLIYPFQFGYAKLQIIDITPVFLYIPLILHQLTSPAGG